MEKNKEREEREKEGGSKIGRVKDICDIRFKVAIIKIFLFLSLLSFFFSFFPPIFGDIRTKTQNTERNAACRPYLIGRALRCRADIFSVPLG